MEEKLIIIKWANIKLPNNEILHIGFDITQERTNEILLYESKTIGKIK